MIKRCFCNMDKEMFLPLYKSIVRPHLEYGSNIWSIIYKNKCDSNRKCAKKSYKTSKEYKTPEL